MCDELRRRRDDQSDAVMFDERDRGRRTQLV